MPGVLRDAWFVPGRLFSVNRTPADGSELVIHKNNSDGKGNSYGCHENYLMDRLFPGKARRLCICLYEFRSASASRAMSGGKALVPKMLTMGLCRL